MRRLKWTDKSGKITSRCLFIILSTALTFSGGDSLAFDVPDVGPGRCYANCDLPTVEEPSDSSGWDYDYGSDSVPTPSGPSPQQLARDAANTKGLAAYDRRDFKKAIQYFKEALSHDFHSSIQISLATSLNNYANSFFMDGNYAKALQFYQESFQHNPDDPIIQENIQDAKARLNAQKKQQKQEANRRVHASQLNEAKTKIGQMLDGLASEFGSSASPFDSPPGRSSPSPDSLSFIDPSAPLYSKGTRASAPVDLQFMDSTSSAVIDLKKVRGQANKGAKPQGLVIKPPPSPSGTGEDGLDDSILFLPPPVDSPAQLPSLPSQSELLSSAGSDRLKKGGYGDDLDDSILFLPPPVDSPAQLPSLPSQSELLSSAGNDRLKKGGYGDGLDDSILFLPPPVDSPAQLPSLPSQSELLSSAGSDRLKKGDYEGAAQYFREALEENPNDRVLQHMLGVALYKRDSSKQQTSLKATVLLDALEQGKGDWQRSIDYLEKSLNSESKESKAQAIREALNEIKSIRAQQETGQAK